ncbi:SHOCT domain-containing protein [Arthrobacter sp. Ld5]|uniref:SHOCT domain-containing protein n=1 Tax=Arthrobacter sp. Ld5 TaxID=649152 RepID=UPI003EBA3268
MPGLLRGVARTAVVAGTATAVSGRVQRRQAAKFADRDAQTAADRNRAYEQERQEEPASTHADEPPAAAAEPQPDLVTRLRELASLKEDGILTEEEFAAQKAKLLA